jgi:hypothetical protein
MTGAIGYFDEKNFKIPEIRSKKLRVNIHYHINAQIKGEPRRENNKRAMINKATQST